MDKDEVISQVYHDDSGYGSRVHTFKRAHTVNPAITMRDVATWFDRHVENKKMESGFNSWVAHKPHEEYQIDLMFLKDPIVPKKVMKGHQQKGRYAPIIEKEKTEYDPLPDSNKPLMVFCDVFSRRIWIEPLETSKGPDLVEALRRGFVRMGGKPEILYSDQEGGIRSKDTQRFLEVQKIKMIFTRHHAAFVERQIRTIKSMILKRAEQWVNREPPNWEEWRTPAFLTRICNIRNGERENATTAMKPTEAERDDNREQVQDRLEVERKTKRTYENINVDDWVQYYGPKKKPFAKEFASVWVKVPDQVSEKVQVGRQTMYRLKNQPSELYLRAEIRKVHPP